MMSIIDVRSFFSELTNKIKKVEVRLEGLDVFASNVGELKDFFKGSTGSPGDHRPQGRGCWGKKEEKRPSTLFQRRP